MFSYAGNELTHLINRSIVRRINLNLYSILFSFAHFPSLSIPN